MFQEPLLCRLELCVCHILRRTIDNDIRRNARTVNGASIRCHIFCDRQFQPILVEKRQDCLYGSLAVGSCADDLCRTRILQRTCEDLRRARPALVDEYGAGLFPRGEM